MTPLHGMVAWFLLVGKKKKSILSQPSWISQRFPFHTVVLNENVLTLESKCLFSEDMDTIYVLAFSICKLKSRWSGIIFFHIRQIFHHRLLAQLASSVSFNTTLSFHFSKVTSAIKANTSIHIEKLISDFLWVFLSYPVQYHRHPMPTCRW